MGCVMPRWDVKVFATPVGCDAQKGRRVGWKHKTAPAAKSNHSQRCRSPLVHSARPPLLCTNGTALL